tara:strand:- start:5081 stop:7732 length:2652 start_codon:yes stop_codon:yes gene_type:complete
MKNIKKMTLNFRYILYFILLFSSIFSSGQNVISYKQLNDQIIVSLGTGELHLRPLSDNTVRVQYGQEFDNTSSELVFTEHVKVPDFKVNETEEYLEIATSKMIVNIDRSTGAISYKNSAGVTFLKEKPGSRIFKQSSVQGKPCYMVEQSFESPKDEFLYGTGQFQDGYLNIRGLPRRLTQVNTQISIPFVMSSKGYGLFWHNYGLTDFNPADKFIKLVPDATEGQSTEFDVTTTEGNKKEVRKEQTFSGTLTIEEDAKYAIMLDVGKKMAKNWQVSIDGKEIINLKNLWLPPTTSTFAQLSKGDHNIVVTGEKSDEPVIYYQKVEDNTVFRSPVAEKMDYIVFAGDADEVISSYRNLTGKAPLMPIWSLGYIHCRERFNTQDELLENAKEFRERNLPMDLIVQDWQYWGKYGWNAMKFDEDKYPDPAKMVEELHDMNMRLMVSVWSKIDKDTELGAKFESKGYYIPNTKWVDFFNKEAADYYWENFSSRLLKPYKIDAWWQDATEPENDDLVGRIINNGTMLGEEMRNVYPLFVTKTVYEGSRRDVPDKRVFILTRSGFSGQQRYASAVWTGDVGNDWETLRRQVTAGLNYSITGMPWWTFDAGGFFRPGQDQYDDIDFHERFLRWFQFATFSPLQRVHGYQTKTEFWRYGKEVENEASKYLNFRYRLMPYIYSQAADITFNNGTIMRPLIMDFSGDEKALEQNYEYMFGPAFLVAPVLSKGEKTSEVYLPKNQSGWFDFWTGNHIEGGTTVQTKTDVSTIPLFIKSGSIVPMGKQMQYTGEKTQDAIEIRVYTGTDGVFELYEDEGTNYNYEKGAYSIIPFKWDDKKQTLTIEKRKGSFDGMIKNRIFNIVFVRESHGVGIEQKEIDIVVKYNGNQITVNKK